MKSKDEWQVHLYVPFSPQDLVLIFGFLIAVFSVFSFPVSSDFLDILYF